MDPLKKKIVFFLLILNLDEQLYQICCTLDEILQHKPTHWTPGQWFPPPFVFENFEIVQQ